MLQIEFMDGLRDSARHIKEYTTRKRPKDMLPYVMAQRANDFVSLTTLNQHDREVIVEIGAVCAAGFDADHIGLVFEIYQGAKIAGAGPRPEGYERQAVMCAGVNRAGDVLLRLMPFRYVDGHLYWIEEAEKAWGGSDGTQPVGQLAKHMSRFMTTNANQIPADYPLDRHERDAATALWIDNKGHHTMLLVDGDDTQRVNGLGRYGTFFNPEPRTDL
jgi:hypothetical protein